MSRFLRKEKRKQERGITLIALITTIIVLLILAGITIGAITGSNGIIGQAQSAKEETEISQEKEIIDISTVEAMGKNNRGNLEEEEFQNVLDSHTNGNVTVSDIGEEFEVFFEESNRYYTVDKDGNILDYIEGASDKYPGDITRKEDGTVLDGSEDNPYEINCIEDLVAFSNMVNGTGKVFQNGQMIDAKDAKQIGNESTIILTKNLDFKSSASYINSQRTDFGDINGDDNDGNTLITEMTNENGTGFPPINMNISFIFDGKGYTISNIYEKNRVAVKGLGLFGNLKGYNVTIQNLTVEGKIDNQLESESNYSATGGIVGTIWGTGNNARIYNCKSNVEIFANGYGTAGIIGNAPLNNIDIINCTNTGKINNLSQSTGGIAGIIECTTAHIQNCYNTGEISSTGQVAGGILGNTYGGDIIIENVYNRGEISKNGARGRGGILGMQTNGSQCSIKNAYNMGKIIEQNVNWTYSFGAIVGRTENENLLNIENCYYLQDSCSKEVGYSSTDFAGITSLENIKGEEIMEEFNSYINSNGLKEEGWKEWTLGDDGYPTLEE